MKIVMHALVAILLVGCRTSHVPATHSHADLERYVMNAARLVERDGAGACHAFTKPEWRGGDYYIFVTDAVSHVTVCHPVRPELVGQDQTDLRDSNGRYFIREMMEVAAKPEAKGWIEYAWPRPGETAPSLKTAFVVGVNGPDGKRYVVGSGAYDVAD